MSPIFGPGRAEVVARCEENLRPARASGHADDVEELERLLDEHRVVLPARERRHAAADVARERLHLFERYRVAFAVPRKLREALQIERGVARDDGEQHTRPVASADQRLEDLLRREPYATGDFFRGEVLVTRVVVAELVRNVQRIEEAGRVRLHGSVHHDGRAGFVCHRESCTGVS